MKRILASGAACGVLLFLGASPARAQQWTYTGSPEAGVALTDTSSLGLTPSFTLAIQGQQVTIINDATGSFQATYNCSPNNIDGYATPVPEATGTYVYVADEGGNVSKFNTSGMTSWISHILTSDGKYGVQFTTTPIVQLGAYSNTAYTSKYSSTTNLVIIGVNDLTTTGGTGTTTGNQVIALDGATGAELWRANQQLNLKMDVPTSCVLNYDANLVYCAADDSSVFPQPTLFAISTLNGQVVWSKYLNPVRATPQQSGHYLFVATTHGSLWKIDLDNPTATGTLAAVTGGTGPGELLSDPWITYGGKQIALLTDSTGTLHGIDESTTEPVTLFATNTLHFSSGPVQGDANYAYVGTNAGSLCDFDVRTGLTRECSKVGMATSTTFDPALGISNSNATAVDRIFVTANDSTHSYTQSYAVPFVPPACSQDSDCKVSDEGQCVIDTCVSGKCQRTFKPDGYSCDDGKDCTCSPGNADPTGNCPSGLPSGSDECLSGVCTGRAHAKCTCAAIGDAACIYGDSCCSSTPGCVNLLTDPNNCGACGTICASYQFCNNGVCLRQGCLTKPFPNATTFDSFSSDLTDVTGLAYDPNCNAYMSSMQRMTGTNTGVDMGGGPDMGSGGPDMGAVSGYAVLRLTAGSSPNPILSRDFSPYRGNGIALQYGNPLTYAIAVPNEVSGTTPTFTPAMYSATGWASSTHYFNTASSTYSSTPFAALAYDQGPVGPSFPNSTAALGFFMANVFTNGDLLVAPINTNMPFSGTSVYNATNFSTGMPERITAISEVGATISGYTTNEVYIAHGSTLTVWGSAGGGPLQHTDIDLSSSPFPNVTAILSIAADQNTGECYVEVVDSGGLRHIVYVVPVDVTTYAKFNIGKLGDVQYSYGIRPQVPDPLTQNGDQAGDDVLAWSPSVIERLVRVPGEATVFYDIEPGTP